MQHEHTVARVLMFRPMAGAVAWALFATLQGCCPRPPAPTPLPDPIQTEAVEPAPPTATSRIVGYWKVADGGVHKSKVCQFTPDGRILIFDVKRIRMKEGQEQGWWSPNPDLSHPEGEVLTISFTGYEPDSQVVFTRSGVLMPIPPGQGPTLQLIPARP